jgi:hypothetical protein
MPPESLHRGRRVCQRVLLHLAVLSGISTAAVGEEMQHDHAQMDHSKMNHAIPGQSGAGTPVSVPSPGKKKKKMAQYVTSGAPITGQVDHAHMKHDMAGHMMKGFLGPYPITREASGTSWVPDTTPHEGLHRQLQDWSVMTHGWINLNTDRQDGPRGANKTFVSGMLMTMAQRPLSDGTFGVRAMLSPEPLMGPNGYPLLLATGETANGVTHLVDRQHPHDLFMELAATYSYNLSSTSSLFVYGGLPGEPALGPPAFMHRTSGMDNPEAPISHHWLDSTHITFGVVTAGVVLNDWKLEASAFRGREPDQFRYDIERPSLDSFAGRISWNPVRELSLQVSYGHLASPEQLAPAVNEDRATASAIYTTPFGDGHLWSTTLAWGHKMLRPGDSLDAWLVESAAILKPNVALFMRAERVAENELTDDIPGLEGKIFTVNKLTVGGIYDFLRTERTKFGIGALASRVVLPVALKAEYGRDLTSFMLFGRLKLL